MIENFNPFICLGGDNEKINHIAEAAIEMNLTCNDLKKDLNLSDGDVVDMLQLVMDRFKNRNSIQKNIFNKKKLVKNILIELSNFSSVKNLWPELIENFGFEKAKNLISQANDLQKMNGIDDITMPIIFIGTGGLALIAINLVEKNIAFEKRKGKKVLIFNPKKKTFQILYETK